ncbi:toll/interleukin-1 receptor domain-containing protein [bacterium]|nr:toll/interleukin-1 receptor domain-containing protein [bacterium]
MLKKILAHIRHVLDALAELLSGWIDTLSSMLSWMPFLLAVESDDNDVDCTVYAKKSVTAGKSTLVLVWVHKPDQSSKVRRMSQEMIEAVRRTTFITLDGDIQPGQELTFHMEAAGVSIDTPVRTMRWKGETYPVTYEIEVPADYPDPILIGRVRIACDHVPCGRVTFEIAVTSRELAPDPQSATKDEVHRLKRYELAFISYATPDRSEVVKRLPMLTVAGIEYRQDLLSLEPGDRWEERLYHYIDEADLFLLFWSSAAKTSEWVDREVEHALDRKGGRDENPPDIVPVIIEGPPVPEPPPKLCHLHFNDSLIYFTDP